MKILVTGSSGLIGSEAVLFFDGLGHSVIGVDNNMRRTFFGPVGDTKWNEQRVLARTRDFRSVNIDVRDRAQVTALVAAEKFDAVIHCAAQPSHDKAGEIPLLDFEVNAIGTVNLLEACRQHCREAAFVFMSTNKVYGDAPNEIPLTERPKRWDYANAADYQGVSENCRIDRSLHSLFGASKASADLMAQEYGKYYGMNVGVFRGGCLTGSGHSAVELHGFLAYLVKATLEGIPYTVYGYQGKQVRDQIHSSDVVQAFWEFINAPRQGEVYNLGGGRANNLSILEAIDSLERATGRRLVYEYQDQARRGDHICYISDMSKFRSHYPGWTLSVGVDDIIGEIVDGAVAKQGQ